MKKIKKTLPLNKLVISKLNNQHTILGGGSTGCNARSEVLPLCPRPSQKNCPTVVDCGDNARTYNCGGGTNDCVTFEGC